MEILSFVNDIQTNTTHIRDIIGKKTVIRTSTKQEFVTVQLLIKKYMQRHMNRSILLEEPDKWDIDGEQTCLRVQCAEKYANEFLFGYHANDGEFFYDCEDYYKSAGYKIVNIEDITFF